MLISSACLLGKLSVHPFDKRKMSCQLQDINQLKQLAKKCKCERFESHPGMAFVYPTCVSVYLSEQNGMGEGASSAANGDNL